MAKLLVVEDDPALLAGMKDILSIEGHEVSAVASGQEALSAIEAEPPDLIISDIIMPEMTGPELLTAMRSSPGGRSIPFLFVSARMPSDLEERIAEEERVSFVRKPFEIEILLEAVSAALTPPP